MQQVANTFNTIAERSEVQQQLVYETGKQIPGSVQYTIKRFVKTNDWVAEDTGMLTYHIEPSEPQKKSLQLRFCITGNMY